MEDKKVFQLEVNYYEEQVNCHDESSTLKLDWFGVVWNMKGHILVISKTNFVLVVDKLFPRSDDGLGKCKLNFCICM